MPRTLSLTLLAVALAAAEDGPTIIVTAERRETELERAPVSVELVEADDVAVRGGSVNATDWLRELPGVAVWSTGGGVDGGTTALRLRGLDGKYTLVLVDGIPFEDQSSINGGVRLPLFAPAGVDAIEVLKGSQSGLYGSGAVGGVVDLRTARPTADHELRVSATAGSFGTLAGETVATGPIPGIGGYAISLQGLASDGFSSTTSDPEGDPSELEDDSTQRHAARGRFEFDAADGLTLHVVGATVRNRQEYDGSGPDDADSENLYEQQQLAAGAGFDRGTGVSLDIDLSWQNSSYESTYTTNDPGTYDSTTLYGSARGTVGLGGGVDLTLGADARRDTAMTRYSPASDPVFDTGIGQFGGYLGAAWTHERAEVAATARLDRHQEFGEASTGRLAAAWFVLPASLKVRAAASTGFKAPTLYQLYNVEPFVSNGNPDLQPEDSLSYEAGFDWTVAAGFKLSATAFRIEVDDQIVYNDPDGWSGPLLATYLNDRGTSVSRGMEAGAAAERAVTDAVTVWLEGSYTLLDAEDATGRETPFAPHHAGSTRASLRETLADGLALRQTIGVRRTTAYYANTGGSDRVDGATVADAAIGVSMGERWDLALRIDNLFDQRYVTNSSFGTVYATAPRSYWLTLAGRF